MSKPLVYPSILSADFSILGDEIKAVEKAGADGIHFDVMDGHFVPNLSFGAPVLKKIRKHIKTEADCHLMVQNPDHLFPSFVDSGADRLTVHLEACADIKVTLDTINKLGVKAGVSIKPKTSLEELKSLFDTHANAIDLVLIMSVEPGFGGQAYIEESTQRALELSKTIKQHTQIKHLQIDGGINADTAIIATQAGVTNLVAGSYIFGKDNYKSAIDSLRSHEN